MAYSEQLKEWADSRNTSYPVAAAIWELAETLEDRQRIWQEPTDFEFDSVKERAVRMNGLSYRLYWGEERLL